METMLLIVHDFTGHSKFEISWDPDREADVEDIRELFLDLQQKGYFFFECKRVLGLFKKEGKAVSDFNPNLGRLYVRKESSIKVEESPDAEEIQDQEFNYFDPKRQEFEPTTQYIAAQIPVGG